MLTRRFVANRRTDAMCRYTIAIPAFKAKYFEAALRSALAQDFTDAEVLVVDDASPEDLASIVERVRGSLKDCRIQELRYERNEVGCGAMDLVRNWNICLQHARGEYIILMGDDDLLSEDALSVYEKAVSDRPGLEVYHAATVLIDGGGRTIRAVAPKAPFEDIVTLLSERILHCREQYIGDFCFDVHALRSRGGFFEMPLAWGSDDITVFRAAEQKGIANCLKPTYFYRVSSSSISSDTSLTCTKIEGTYTEQLWVRDLLARLGTSVPASRHCALGTVKRGEAKAFDRRRVSLVRAAVRNGARLGDFAHLLDCRAMAVARWKVFRDRLLKRIK